MKRTVLCIGIVLLLLSVGVWGILKQRNQTGTIAVITRNGEELERIDLAGVEKSYCITYDWENGERNVILVENGSIRMQEASCPDAVCIRTGAITDSSKPIVCLPNHLIITILPEENS